MSFNRYWNGQVGFRLTLDLGGSSGFNDFPRIIGFGFQVYWIRTFLSIKLDYVNIQQYKKAARGLSPEIEISVNTIRVVHLPG
jgi:hypothetical protein